MAHDPLARPACPQCGRPITRHQAIQPGHCGARDCLERQAVAGARARRERLEREWQDRVALARARAGDRIAALTDDRDPAVGAVPDGDRPLSPLPGERRAAFEAHLRRVVTEALAAPDSDTPDPQAFAGAPIPPALVSAACATCRGYCCRLGGGERHAFLTVRTFLRLRHDFPEEDAETMIGAYLARLPETAVTDSCVYHTDTGCALPRARRDQTCNVFHCTDLHRLGRMPEGTGALPLVLAAVQGDTCARLALYTPEDSAVTEGQNPRATEAS